MTAASFRDPSGRVFLHEGQIYRAINKLGIQDFDIALKSETLREFMDAGNLVGASALDPERAFRVLNAIDGTALANGNTTARVVEHERIPFQSFPYEWAPEMLYAAAELTLNLNEKLLGESIGLKDATPYNILFRGPKPVFVDWLSFEKRDPSDPVWLAQAQFIRTFILPLLVNKQFGIPLSQIFLNDRDGLEPEAIYQMCGPLRRLKPPFFTLVTLPRMLGGNNKNGSPLYEKHTSSSPEKARFILEQQLKHLRRLLHKVAPDANRTSGWAEYAGPSQHFTDKYLETKHRFVEDALREFAPKTVLDIGCNTGYFSRIAARCEASVVAIDLDPTSVGRVWRMARKEDLDILPLVVDITRPPPPIGWRNSECSSFLSRVTGKVDAANMLAVIHHMLVTERIPLDEIVDLMAETVRDFLIVEFVPPDDPMFKQIVRGRDHLFDYLDKETFEKACAKRFNIVRSEKLADSNRWLYLLRK